MHAPLAAPGQNRLAGRLNPNRVKLQSDHLEIGFGDAALRAGPICGHVVPKCTGGQTIFRSAFRLVVYKTANNTNIGFHGNTFVNYWALEFLSGRYFV
jgi:hypothetical protein